MTTTTADWEYELQNLQALVTLNVDVLTEGSDYEILQNPSTPTIFVKFAFPLKKGDVVKIIRPNFKCHKFVLKQDGPLCVELTNLQWSL